MGDENPIRTLGDYSKPSHEGNRNTIKLPIGNNVVPLRSDTIRLVQNGCSFHGLWSEDPNQHLKDFLNLVDLLDLDVRSITTWEDLTTRFLAQFFPPGRTAKLRNDILMFQQHHGESLSKAWTLVPTTLSIAWKIPKKPLLNMHPRVPMKREAITDQIAGTLPSDTVKNLKLSTSPFLSARSYPTQDPQCSNHVHGSINAIIIHPKQPEGSQVNRPNEGHEGKGNLGNTSSNPHPQPDPLASITNKQVRKLNSMLESLGLVPQSSNTKFVCSKEDDGEVIFIEIIRDDDEP
ncbi:zinc finger, CCHC-type containing protein [Tanacetum coccineum]|uniref:Zinc finger, CCHC-type containing protein n=1 Tax=Tanacetum coccineum TaxID=301880 RepID=A0ABQ5A0N0_9ASTR